MIEVDPDEIAMLPLSLAGIEAFFAARNTTAAVNFTQLGDVITFYLSDTLSTFPVPQALSPDQAFYCIH